MTKKTPDSQLSLLDNTNTSAGYAAEREPESADEHLTRQRAYDDWQAAYLTRYYAARAADILNSGDEVRIRLYREWQDRQRG